MVRTQKKCDVMYLPNANVLCGNCASENRAVTNHGIMQENLMVSFCEDIIQVSMGYA